MLCRELTNTMRLLMLVFLGMLLAFADEAPAANRPSIDLAVERVWVGSNCRVKVRVVRQGPGRLPGKLAKFTVLGIQVGKKKYAFTFKEIDPKLVLLRGPGAITFSSPIKVSSKATIVAVVDPKGKLTEASEANNRGRAADMPRKCAVASVNLDWLKVRGLFLRKDRLHVVIAFTSKAAIKAGELGRVRLGIKSKATQGSWSLARVYRQAKPRGKGLKAFNTQLRLKPGAKVMVAFRRAKQVKQQVFTLPKPPAKKAKAKGPGGSGGPGIPIMLNRGIAIFKPTSRKVAHRGGTIGVLYGLGPDAPAGVIEFALYRGPQKFNSIQGRYIPSGGSAPVQHSVEFPIPNNVAYGEGYYIKGAMGGLWGESDKFSIQPIVEWGPAGGMGIRVMAPTGPAELVHYSLQTISWRVSGDYSGEPAFDVSLVQGGRTIETIDSSRVTFNEASQTYTLVWRVPDSAEGESAPVEGDGFRIKVADRNGPSEDTCDQAFTILERRPGQPMAGGIIISQPRAGSRVVSGERIDIEWDFDPNAIQDYGGAPSGRVNVRLVRVSTSPGVPDTGVYSRTTTDRRTTLNTPIQTRPAEFYMEVRYPVPGETDEHQYRGVTGYFRIVPRNHLELIWPPRRSAPPRTLSVFNSYLIRWDALGAARSATLDIILSTRQAGIPSIRLIRNIPASDGQWRWSVGPDCSNWMHYGSHFQIQLVTNGMGDNNLRSNSDFFTIATPALDIRRPAANQSWPLGRDRAIHWRSSNIPSNKRVRITLMKGNESYMDISRNVLISDERYVWQVGYTDDVTFSRNQNFGPPSPPPPGCDYRIRLSLEGCFGVKVFSPNFCLR